MLRVLTWGLNGSCQPKGRSRDAVPIRPQGRGVGASPTFRYFTLHRSLPAHGKNRCVPKSKEYNKAGMELDEIKVGSRHRINLSSIRELALSTERVGLLHPLWTLWVV